MAAAETSAVKGDARLNTRGRARHETSQIECQCPGRFPESTGPTRRRPTRPGPRRVPRGRGAYTGHRVGLHVAQSRWRVVTFVVTFEMKNSVQRCISMTVIVNTHTHVHIYQICICTVYLYMYTYLFPLSPSSAGPRYNRAVEISDIVNRIAPKVSLCFCFFNGTV